MSIAEATDLSRGSTPRRLSISVHQGHDLAARLPALESYVLANDGERLSRRLDWLRILPDALGHTPYCLEATDGRHTRGILPLVCMRSLLFGRFLVSLPYLNYGGVMADDDPSAEALIARAVELADELDVRFLELRHERNTPHPHLASAANGKVNMRLPLPPTPEELWRDLPQKARNRVRKARTYNFSIAWGGEEVLDEFFGVFSRNMRDLGTPVYGKALFRTILGHFPNEAEICVARDGTRPVSAALLLHGRGVSEVPSASSVRSDNLRCANMLMYWHLLERAVVRKQHTFDFGRSTVDSGTYHFKRHWGAVPHPTEWQFYCRQGDMHQMRPASPRYRRLIQIWQRLPLSLAKIVGPICARGIP